MIFVLDKTPIIIQIFYTFVIFLFFISINIYLQNIILITLFLTKRNKIKDEFEFRSYCCYGVATLSDWLYLLSPKSDGYSLDARCEYIARCFKRNQNVAYFDSKCCFGRFLCNDDGYDGNTSDVGLFYFW